MRILIFITIVTTLLFNGKICAGQEDSVITDALIGQKIKIELLADNYNLNTGSDIFNKNISDTDTVRPSRREEVTFDFGINYNPRYEKTGYFKPPVANGDTAWYNPYASLGGGYPSTLGYAPKPALGWQMGVWYDVNPLKVPEKWSFSFGALVFNRRKIYKKEKEVSFYYYNRVDSSFVLYNPSFKKLKSNRINVEIPVLIGYTVKNFQISAGYKFPVVAINHTKKIYDSGNSDRITFINKWFPYERFSSFSIRGRYKMKEKKLLSLIYFSINSNDVFDSIDLTDLYFQIGVERVLVKNQQKINYD